MKIAYTFKTFYPFHFHFFLPSHLGTSPPHFLFANGGASFAFRSYRQSSGSHFDIFPTFLYGYTPSSHSFFNTFWLVSCMSRLWISEDVTTGIKRSLIERVVEPIASPRYMFLCLSFYASLTMGARKIQDCCNHIFLLVICCYAALLIICINCVLYFFLVLNGAMKNMHYQMLSSRKPFFFFFPL